ncbi:hypothetical protein ABW636_13135 [Aquimarina sp. 2201CG1-2-11]|uniref:hypothetical protein n=1 Tax=Aquimarina discodermiae TaxID=3231043 RepID=UPI0034628C74
MKLRLSLLTFFLLFVFVSTAQSIYKSGYFIDNSGKRTECLVKKMPWETNPTEFEWKKTISSSPKKENIEDIKEFGVGQDYIFKRFIMAFDLQGDTVGKSSKDKDPRLRLKKVFLRLILKSEATLYQYSKNDVHRFFYTDRKFAYPELLVYKTYYVPDLEEDVGEKVIPKENTQFRDQLAQSLKCKNQDPSEVEYTLKDLKKYFKDYNECKGAKIAYMVKTRFNQSKIGIIGTLDFVSFSHPSELNPSETLIYDDILAPRYGIYLETFIPFFGVDLSFFLESTYRSFSTKHTNFANPDAEGPELNFKSINVAFAPRFHLYLSSNFEVFFEGGLSVDQDLGTESIFNSIESTTLDYFYGGGFGAGRFKVGYRVYTDKNIAKREALSDALSESTLSTSSFFLTISLSKSNRNK